MRKLPNMLPPRRLMALWFAAALLGLGIAMCILAGLGSDVYTCLQQGIGQQLGLALGTVNFLLNGILLAVFLFYDRSLVGVGSVMMCLLTGPFISLFQYLLKDFISVQSPFELRLMVTVLGILCNAVAIGWYLPLQAGVQPMDMLVLTIARLCRKTYGFGMFIFSAAALAVARILGGTIGIGTLINIALIGVLVDCLSPLLALLLRRFLRSQ